jgi:hypothetical protein
MKTIALKLAFSALLLPAAVAAAQSDTMWDKSYPVSGQPSLVLSTGDSHLNIHACSGCNAVHIHVTAENTSLSRYTLEERQSGDTVHFPQEKPRMGCTYTAPSSVQSTWRHRESHVGCQSADGNLTAAGLHGDLTIHTSDGSQELTGVGESKIALGDGHLRVQNEAGRLKRKFPMEIKTSRVFHSLQRQQRRVDHD